jgi:hypothetical protein
MDLLTTPGISTHIASHLTDADATIETLYKLVGHDSRTQHELQPFVDAIREKRKLKTLRNIKRRNRRRIKKMLTALRAYINEIELVAGPKRKRIRLILTMFEYLCSIKNDISLLKNHLSATTIMNTLDRLCAEARGMRNTDLYTKAMECKQQLVEILRHKATASE